MLTLELHRPQHPGSPHQQVSSCVCWFMHALNRLVALPNHLCSCKTSSTSPFYSSHFLSAFNILRPSTGPSTPISITSAVSAGFTPILERLVALDERLLKEGCEAHLRNEWANVVRVAWPLLMVHGKPQEVASLAVAARKTFITAWQLRTQVIGLMTYP